MGEQNNISSSEDSSEEEVEDFDAIWESHIEIKEEPSDVEADADVQDTEKPEVETTFPQTDFRSFNKYF